jgi:DNA-cytosine methyltransferase
LPGAASDREVAAAHGVRRETVTHYRRRHGIPAAGRAGRPPWAPCSDIEPQPGEASNAAVAAAHGVNVKTVAAWRARQAVAPLRALDLFAGAGGASLGLKRAGLELVGAAEWSVAACATHREALPACPVYEGDLRKLTPPAADLWWASPPCQAWSIAGARLGARDVERNGWPWVWEFYDRAQHKPRWLIVENVAGMTHHSKDGHGDPMTCSGCYLEHVVLPALRARFAHVVTRVLDAADYGVPQHRRRLFVVCSVTPYTWPQATHCAPGSLLTAAGRQPWVTMGAALGLASIIGGGTNPRAKGQAHARTYADLTNRPSTTVAAVQVGNAGPFVLHHGRNTAANPKQERPIPSTEPAPSISGKGNQLKQHATGRRRLTVAECATLQGFPALTPTRLSALLGCRFSMST